MRESKYNYLVYFLELPVLLFSCLLIGCSSNDQNKLPDEVIQEAPAGQLSTPAGNTVPGCDRVCLEGFIDRYLEALSRNDPSGLPLADDIVYSENNQLLDVGDGTWRTVTGLGNYRHYFADPEQGQAAVMTVIEENGEKIIYNLRLAIANRKITEIEAMVVRSPAGADNLEKLGVPLPEFLESIPVDQRVSREDLVATANKYLTGMENNDPNGDYSFFAEDCDRLEHGIKTTNNKPAAIGHTTNTEFVTMTCRQQFERGGLAFVTRIRDRRYVVVDEERQSVFGLVVLDHNGTVREIELANGVTSTLPPYFSTPRTLLVGEAWRIRKDRLFKIEMTLTEVPYGNRPVFIEEEAGWLTYAGNDVSLQEQGSRCDKACLEKVVDNFLDAMVSHDPDRLAMPATVKYTENGQQLSPGDGLWGTLTALGDFKMVLTDEENVTAGVYASTIETDIPGILMARLKIAGSQVSEIEVVVARNEYTGQRGGTLTLFGPHLDTVYEPDVFINTLSDVLDRKPGKNDTAANMSAIVNQFYNGFLNNDGGLAPFAGDCRRRINGHLITNNNEAPVVDPEFPDYRPYGMSCGEQIDSGVYGYISRIRNRKELVVDTEKGLLMELVMFDVADPLPKVQVAGVGDVRLPGVTTGPYTMLVTNIFRIDKGKITDIEAVLLPVPYGMNSGW